MTPPTERFLSAPILPTLLRLSAPGLLLVLFQSLVSVGDTYFVGRLGTVPLAGLALVFPLIMLLQMTSSGAMGGGVSSAIARALGRGDPAGARRIVVHALVIACAMGAVFTLLVLVLGEPIFRLLGGSPETVAQALAYSRIVFAGAAAVWLANTLSSVLRGTGNMIVPALALIGAALIHLPLSGALVLGAGPLPKLGIAGAGVAYVTTFSLAAIFMSLVIFGRASALRPRAGDFRLERRVFREILRVGGLSMLSSLQTVLTAVILTGFVGRFGTAALAGYGVGLRLELLQIPLVFAIGQALVVLVGTNIGAGRGARAKRISWLGAAIGAAISLAIGASAALFPGAWVGLFSDDAAVHVAGSLYLRVVGPFFPFLGIGITLYFASQGAGRVFWPLLAGSARLAVVIAGGFIVASLPGIFALIALAMVVYGGLTTWFIARSDWRGA